MPRSSKSGNPSTLNVSYTYGHQLLSQNRAGTRSYYHADHLGTTRALSGQPGTPTDRYAFDAYGRLLTPTPQLPTPTCLPANSVTRNWAWIT